MYWASRRVLAILEWSNALTNETKFYTIESEFMREDAKKERFDVVLTHEKTEIRKKEWLKKEERSLGWYYLGLVGEMGFVIALPIVAGGIGGLYIDRWLGTKPAATILFLLVGIILSLIGFFNAISTIVHKRS